MKHIHRTVTVLPHLIYFKLNLVAASARLAKGGYMSRLPCYRNRNNNTNVVARPPEIIFLPVVQYITTRKTPYGMRLYFMTDVHYVGGHHIRGYHYHYQ